METEKPLSVLLSFVEKVSNQFEVIDDENISFFPQLFEANNNLEGK